ncbi:MULTISPECIES: pilus assembly protein N-terminal domain-containing protein [Bosea]|uniref:pilus assembly protein N-terminal domain-containing protein n=1 Tax=Bosea TaxID=85413 RepID=UPI0021501BD3|nr:MULTISPECIES: pilus assembly protein N-terminal domain-containing protein [Bosea]MCR4523211.1 pilus assembly protein N-terminal domain-containing protein [Bosea sp. 47.2.35]MDR6830202.1 Flp pilus assembly secretin CpaC [Bosea robiniae]MDR6895534.1 Flp pilus assembly secretin CpaC [Bosea sp. BE109]MDR7138930.1 Flp pilus assembly secretin CpaC [Bosea sp. BE168]MDR7175631.1 Flp pilus assembly secretin CpaC [Bosea sp. BE271]
MLIIRAPEGRRWLTRWAAATALAIAACGGADAAPQRAQSDAVIVTVDHAKVVRLPEKAQTVVVGNPAIADVSVQRNGVMIVTGKSFGVTNLIALDANGALLAESLVRVGKASDEVLTVQRGMDRESYSCNPECQPSVQMGDESRFFANTSGQATARNALATTAGRN